MDLLLISVNSTVVSSKEQTSITRPKTSPKKSMVKSGLLSRYYEPQVGLEPLVNTYLFEKPIGSFVIYLINICSSVQKHPK